MNLRSFLSKSLIYKYIYHPIKLKQIRQWQENRHQLFVENGAEVLRRFVECMEQNGITYWLEFGSLLGVYRDGEFVPNERDLDIGVRLNDARRVYKALINNGFSLCREYHIVGENGLEQTYELNGVTVDLMYFYEEDGLMWCDGSVTPSKVRGNELFYHKVTAHHYEKFGVKTIPFLDFQVSVPDNTEHHLIEIFGPGYRVYDPNFKVDLNKVFYSMDEKKGFGFRNY